MQIGSHFVILIMNNVYVQTEFKLGIWFESYGRLNILLTKWHAPRCKSGASLVGLCGAPARAGMSFFFPDS